MDTVKNVEKAGRHLWLAGLGACLVGKEYAVKKLDDLFEATTLMANEVMSKGQELEGELKGKFPKGFVQDDKVAELREKLGLNKESKQAKISKLAAKVEALTDIVATISVKVEEEKLEGTPVKKAEVKEVVTAQKNETKRTTTRKPRRKAVSSQETSSSSK
jgi:hypothetical protein